MKTIFDQQHHDVSEVVRLAHSDAMAYDLNFEMNRLIRKHWGTVQNIPTIALACTAIDEMGGYNAPST